MTLSNIYITYGFVENSHQEEVRREAQANLTYDEMAVSVGAN